MPTWGVLSLRGVLSSATRARSSALGFLQACGAARASSSMPSGIIEIREYTLAPDGMKQYLSLTTETASLRSQLLPFLGCADRKPNMD